MSLKNNVRFYLFPMFSLCLLCLLGLFFMCQGSLFGLCHVLLWRLVLMCLLVVLLPAYLACPLLCLSAPLSLVPLVSDGLHLCLMLYSPAFPFVSASVCAPCVLVAFVMLLVWDCCFPLGYVCLDFNQPLCPAFGLCVSVLPGIEITILSMCGGYWDYCETFTGCMSSFFNVMF